MGIRYDCEALLALRKSKLCIKPPNLPPPEEYMGLPDAYRAQNKTTTDRTKAGSESPLLDQTNRRAPSERHMSRNSANPDDIILGPPRTSFASANLRNGKPVENDKTYRDQDSRERFNFRNKSGDLDLGDRLREGRANNNFRRRGDNDQDSDGWTAVKPRKSFGHEGAERFHGRMAGSSGIDNRKVRDQDSLETGRDRPRRTFDNHSRDKEVDEGESRRNGANRGRSEPWFKDDNDGPTARERIDRAKSWRDRDERQGDFHAQRNNAERSYGGRWGERERDQRSERDPEWLDEPAEEKSQGHTEEDFKRFMESMKTGKNPTNKLADDQPSAVAENAPAASVSDKPKPVITPAVETGPDKFFAAFGSGAGIDPPVIRADANKETSRTKMGKSSRFTSFFTVHEETRRSIEPAAPAPMAPPPPLEPLEIQHARHGITMPSDTAAEKEAFQVLLQKLQRQTVQSSGTPPSAGGFAQPPPPPPQIHDPRPHPQVASPESFQPYTERRDDARFRPPPQHAADSYPRPMPPSQSSSTRPEQMLQDLVGQRAQATSQGSSRHEQNTSVANSNTEFLMKLMQSARNAPEPPRTEQLIMRVPQPTRPAAIPQLQDREPDYQRDRSASQRQIRPQGLPAFFDEPFLAEGGDNRPPQPTQILQRPPPPGLEHPMHPSFTPGAGQVPLQQRPMIPPPGLLGNQPNRAIPGMFPPNFPPGGFPPEGLVGPPRNMPPPPGFFGGPPPPGFMPPPGMGGFQGPDVPGFGAPFDVRGMPPPGSGAAFRRP